MTPAYEDQFGPIQRRIQRILRGARWFLKGLRAEERHLLVELNWRLGDEIMALPAFDALHQHDANVQIHVLSNYPVLFHGMPHVHVSESPPPVVDRYVLLRGASRLDPRLPAYCAKLGVPTPDARPLLHFDDWTLPPHLRIPKGKGPLLAFAAGASWPSKRWPRDRWRSLGAALTRYGCRLIVLGQPGEGLPCGWDLTGKTTVEEAARVLHAADLVVCCDSGLMHLALAAGTPVVALFGPTDPAILIQEDPRFTAIRSTAPCSGFWNHAANAGAPGVCPEGHECCLESITVAAVEAAVCERLGLDTPAMKILFLTLYPEAAASPRYRVHQFLPYLRAAGLDCTVMAPMDEAAWRAHTGPGRRGRAFWYHVRETPARLRQIMGARDYDVVFLQKAIMSAYIRGFDGLLRRRSRRLILDVDDAVHQAPPHPLRFPWSLAEDRDQVRRLMQSADQVLAGNNWLVAQAEDAGGAATLFPTVVDTERFVPPDSPPESFRVGWMGAPSTCPSLNAIAPALEELAAGELIVAGADPKEVHLRNARYATWNIDTEVSLLQSFSVGVMPLPRDEWTRGKCALKALLYMAVGIPCIATPHGAVNDIIVHGENGWLADSEDDWREGLSALRDPALRQRLGAAARATVEARFPLHQAAPRLRQLLESS